MRNYLRLSFVLLVIPGYLYALTPVSNVYAGLMVGGSHASGFNIEIANPINGYSGSGALSYSMLGNVAAQFGVRKQHVRFEGELLFNNNSYSHLTINGVNIPNNNSSSSTSVQLKKIKIPPLPFTFSGYTNTYAGLVNGFYDFFSADDRVRVAPYVGMGLGYQCIQDTLQFFANAASIKNITETRQTAAGQAIAGIGYFITDYTSLNLDFRYLSTLNGPARTLSSVNFMFNTTFDLG